MSIRTPYIAHISVVTLGLLAMVTSARAARSYSGLSLFPPDPRTLVPASATTYLPLNGDAGTAARARRDVAAATRLDNARLAGALDLLTALGDRAGVAEWSTRARPEPPDAQRQSCPTSTTSSRGVEIALIAQLKMSDAVALTQDALVKRRLGKLLQGLSYAVSYTCAAHAIYHVTAQDGGDGYASIVASEGVLASDRATIDRIILANR